MDTVGRMLKGNLHHKKQNNHQKTQRHASPPARYAYRRKGKTAKQTAKGAGPTKNTHAKSCHIDTVVEWPLCPKNMCINRIICRSSDVKLTIYALQIKTAHDRISYTHTYAKTLSQSPLHMSLFTFSICRHVVSSLHSPNSIAEAASV